MTEDSLCPHSARIQVSEDNDIDIYGYRRNPTKSALCKILYVVTLGFLRLVFYWKPEWFVKATCYPCSLQIAEKILIRDVDHAVFLRKVRYDSNALGFFSVLQEDGTDSQVESVKYFTLRKLKFVYYYRTDGRWKGFRKIIDLDQNLPTNYFYGTRFFDGLDQTAVDARRRLYGLNEIRVTLTPLHVLLFKEALGPFYLFQAFSVAVWFSGNYYIYAIIIILISLSSIGVNVYLTRKNQVTLHQMTYSEERVKVWRQGRMHDVSSLDLVVGDTLMLTSTDGVAFTMQCDAVLLGGTCVVDESVLTGESTPVTKIPLLSCDNEPYNMKHHQAHTLFGGTRILLVKGAKRTDSPESTLPGAYARATVIRTGYSTAKGQLVRSILYPKPIDFAFTKDLFKFLAVMSVLVILGLVYAMVLMDLRGWGAGKIISRGLDIITIVIPPFLPVAMTIGVIAAERRLKTWGIFCISPTTINTCGAVTCACFDKTGTLTENGLDLMGVLPAEKLSLSALLFEPADLDYDSHLMCAMASCHSLNMVHGQPVGDPMDRIIFDSSKYTPLDDSDEFEREKAFRENDENMPESASQPDLLHSSGLTVRSPNKKLELRQLEIFPFNSTLKRMTVLTERRKISNMVVRTDIAAYSKGAPEILATLCKPSALHPDYTSIVELFSKRGFRIIAIAYKTIATDSSYSAEFLAKQCRDTVETDFDFCGLVIFENRLKTQTKAVIQGLNEARMRTVMITGDNLSTAVSVALECEILNVVKPTSVVTLAGQALPKMRRKTHNLGDLETDLRLENWSSLDEQRQFSVSYETIHRKNSGESDKNVNRAKHSQRLESIDETAPLEQDYQQDYQLAVDGPTLKALTAKHTMKELANLYSVCDVYARMSPEQKIQVVSGLQCLGYVVAMCGDGANDCGALKAAHAGISLSEAEASIASPFTSKTPDIMCVPLVISEGRCALVTSFGIFKYMICYSLTQFISVSLLYWIGTTLDDLQFLYIDLFITTTFMIFFGCTWPCPKLSPEPPPSRLLTISSLLSILLQISLVLLIQLFVYFLVEAQPWFVPFTDPGDYTNNASYQGTALFIVSLYQYISLMLVYSKSQPYRRSLISNIYLTMSLVVCSAVTLWFSITPPYFIQYWMSMRLSDFYRFRLLIVLIGCCHIFLAIFLEDILMDTLLAQKCGTKRAEISKAKQAMRAAASPEPNKRRTSTLFLTAS